MDMYLLKFPYRKILQPLAGKLGWLHPDIGIPFAKWCSSSSRNHTSNRDYGSDDEYTAFAENKFKEGIDHVIMGHTHRPMLQTFENGKTLVNTGDWIRSFSYAKLENGKLTLEKLENLKIKGRF